VAEGAATSVYLASSPDASGMTGVYFEGGLATTPLVTALDGAEQERLWAELEGLTTTA
jgi:hypothetical protein